MGDFHQPESLPTLHRLKTSKLGQIEEELKEYSRLRKVTLVLPCLYSELQRKALQGILDELKMVNYVDEIVVSLGGAGRREFEHAKDYFSILPQKLKIIWNDGERIASLLTFLEEEGISKGESGKGRAMWIALGYVLGKGTSSVIAFHDCDIITYDRELIARLCYPVVSPKLNYEFCKGYYMRVTDRLFGRVTRLFVTPILRALKCLTGYHPLLMYLDDFRYPLAGETAMSSNLAMQIPITSGWGVEIGTLIEVYRKAPSNRLCQADLCKNYEHKHQVLSLDNPDSGLLKMSIDIALTILDNLEKEGVCFTESFFDELDTLYTKTASSLVKRYEDDAYINGLKFPKAREALAIRTFSNGLKLAIERFKKGMLPKVNPNWQAVFSTFPGFADRLLYAVKLDNE